MQLQSERGESPVCACLTCDRYVSVRFALVDGVHNLLWAADKPLSASLGNQRHSDVRDKYGDAGGGNGVTGGGACYLDVGDSVFVLVHRQVGLGYWKKGGKRVCQIYQTKPSLSG